MSSVTAFNQTLEEFLTDLAGVFPEEQGFHKLSLKLKKNILINPRSALDKLGPELGNHSNEITARDKSLFYKEEILDGINMGELWDLDISDNNRKAIWDYLNTLLMLSNTIRVIPHNMLSQIENIAQSCVSELETSNVSSAEDIFQLAQKTIFKNGDFQNMLSQMTGSNANMDLSQNEQSSSTPNTPLQLEHTDKQSKKTHKKKHKH